MRISDWSSDVCSSDLIALAGMAFTRHPVPFLGAAFMIGLTSVGAQLLVPFAAHLAPDHRRGRIIGNIMSGLMLGILLARPLSRWLTSLFGWRAVFEIMAEIGRAPV